MQIHHSPVAAQLEGARSIGFLGPGPVSAHIDHAVAFAVAWVAVAGGTPGCVADLGSGGGVPALVLATQWCDAAFTLVEANGRRAEWLRATVLALDLQGRVVVEERRAEEFGRRSRQGFDLVTARGFGRPAVTAECAAPLLRANGWLIVSEPPESNGERWEPDGLARLGLGEGRSLTCPVQDGSASFYAVRQCAPCPETFPRRIGVPDKRPLF